MGRSTREHDDRASLLYLIAWMVVILEDSVEGHLSLTFPSEQAKKQEKASIELEELLGAIPAWKARLCSTTGTVGHCKREDKVWYKAWFLGA